MPPRKGIVKSGNAGNSSKSAKEKENAAQADGNPPPLFPPGSKYPSSLLQERCTKNGWEKPIVDTPKRDDGWAFVVTLTRIVRTKNGQERQSVRMEPHPPYICKSALEARHWGATQLHLSTSSATASNSIVYSLLDLATTGSSLQLNIRRRRRTKVGCTMPIPLLRASP